MTQNADSSFLGLLIELRVAVSIIRAILAEDETFAALAHTGVVHETNRTVRDFARPFLAVFEDFIAGSSLLLEHPEHKATLGVILRSVRHTIGILSPDAEPKNDARIAASHALDLAWHLLASAIRSEIGTRALAAKVGRVKMRKTPRP